ncbi:MAG: hypothetical protein LBO66_07560 [Deltaproteobacteria bacterium]|jgi:hypothetical protein|nr:hypothetical protein [Deltaproteobacteria bacterium]
MTSYRDKVGKFFGEAYTVAEELHVMNLTLHSMNTDPDIDGVSSEIKDGLKAIGDMLDSFKKFFEAEFQANRDALSGVTEAIIGLRSELCAIASLTPLLKVTLWSDLFKTMPEELANSFSDGFGNSRNARVGFLKYLLVQASKAEGASIINMTKAGTKVN